MVSGEGKMKGNERDAYTDSDNLTLWHWPFDLKYHPRDAHDKGKLYVDFRLSTSCLKTPRLWLAITLTCVNGFWHFLAEMLPIKWAIKRRITTPPQINCASTLPGKTGKHENRIFHSNAVLVHCLNSTSCLISSIFLTDDSSHCCMSS